MKCALPSRQVIHIPRIPRSIPRSPNGTSINPVHFSSVGTFKTVLGYEVAEKVLNISSYSILATKVSCSLSFC
jgi:hypothetical protein